MLRIYLSIFAFAVGVALPSLAQERPATMLVLDASGSMWGQVDGVNKIVIARDVLGDLLDTLPDDQALGLTAYGHRRDGDCSDIQTLVMPDAGTRAEIGNAVRAITPKGRTPMTDAVVAAAEALRYKDAPATVILVSDGIETCHPDPCAAAQRLEDTGVAFTAHVVGFDVQNDPEAIAQMQCLAETTGGIFRTAEDASGLAEALMDVSASVKQPMRFRATEGPFGEVENESLVWEIYQEETLVLPAINAARAEAVLAAGSYRVTVLRPSDGAQTDAIFIADGSGRVITLVLPDDLPPATLTGPAEAMAGAMIEIGWDGPALEGDYIAVAYPELPVFETFEYVASGNPVAVQMPPEAGAFELRYVRGDGRTILARAPITITPVNATLAAPNSAPLGSTITVTWTGPAFNGDFLAIAEPGSRINLTEERIREDGPIEIQMPTAVGSFEVRYVLSQARTVLQTRPITSTAIPFALEAPARVAAGSDVQITWTGPDYEGDFLAVAEPGARISLETVRVSRGNPAILEMPDTPGTYELRYVLSQGRTVAFSQPITVE